MKILYLSHIDWSWIKQRPQFMVENLEKKGVDCSVYYQLSIKLLFSKKYSSVNAKPIIKIPLKGSNKFIMGLNNIIQSLFIWIIIKKNKPSIVWLTHPELINILPKKYNSKIIYDCMDDNISFYKPDSWLYKHLFNSEKELLNRSDFVLFSSGNLLKTIEKRYGIILNSKIIRNAFNSSNKLSYENFNSAAIYPKKIAYFGTIASWFDMESIRYSAKENSDVCFYLFGPLENNEILIDLPNNINYMGIVQHSELINIVNNYDVLVMPFKVIPLIESVDPVKLYEYIQFNKPIISVWYSEIDRFKPFCNFYRSREDFSCLVRKSINELKIYTNEERLDFLSKNTWEIRAEEVICELKKL